MHLRGRSLVAIGFLLALVSMRDEATPSQPPDQVTFVPWKVLNPGDEPVPGDVILYWLPISRDDMRRSPLLTSRLLAQYAAQCVGMQVIRPDDTSAIEKLGATGKLPAAVLAWRSGEILDRSGSENGALLPASVEKMVRDAMARLDAAAEKAIDDARAKAASGDRTGAIELYQKVLAERCIFPRKAKDAERALRRLGG